MYTVHAKMGSSLSEFEEEFSRIKVSSASMHIESREYSLFVQRSQIEFHHRLSSICNPQRSIASSPTPARCEDEYGRLLCQKKCLFIGSYGDNYPIDVKIARKVTIEKKTAYLPEVTADLDRLRGYCAQDPSIALEHTHIHKDEPGQQRSKEFYLDKIAYFLRMCEEPGGN